MKSICEFGFARARPAPLRRNPLNASLVGPGRSRMRKEETLQKIKAAESQVRGTKETVLVERDRILRDARREAFELRETLRRQAETRHAEILQEAEAVMARPTEALLGPGRGEADSGRAEAATNLERAIERLIERFKGALNA